MGREERLYKIRNLLMAGRCVRPDAMCSSLEVSRSTLDRDIRHLRDRFDAPVNWSDELGGWVLQRTGQADNQPQFELPGLWFSADEVHALLTMQHLLASLDAGGLLGPHIAPLKRRLGQILDAGAPPKTDVARRVKVQTLGARRMHLPHFQTLGSALLGRQRLQLRYRSRSDGRESEREVSPLRLVHYRDNWYLDAWCHQSDALRSFSVDAVQDVRVVEQEAIEVSDDDLDRHLGAGYGIFAGEATHWAMLRFTPERARWVASERWHPNQVGRWDAAGNWLLSLPYADPRELVMDILRHVPEVEVVAPTELRAEVLRRLRAGVEAMGLDE